MSLSTLSTQSHWGLSLVLGVSLLAGCNSESTTDNNTNEVLTDTSTTTETVQESSKISYADLATYSHLGAIYQSTGGDDDEIAQLIKAGIDYTAETLSTHQDNYIFSPYQSGRTLAMLAVGAGTGPDPEAPVLDAGNGQTIDPNTRRQSN